MERVVFDSDLYIDRINTGSHEELLLGRWFVSLVNDCLIALSSRQVGATVITEASAIFGSSIGLFPSPL
jgi:hypothetical protein